MSKAVTGLPSWKNKSLRKVKRYVLSVHPTGTFGEVQAPPGGAYGSSEFFNWELLTDIPSRENRWNRDTARHWQAPRLVRDAGIPGR